MLAVTAPLAEVVAQSSVPPRAARAGPVVPTRPQHSWAVTFAELREWGVESNENWDAIQDPAGRVFVANGRGILVYDGEAWQVIKTPRETAVRSLAIGPGNRVFAGAQGEFGYLEPDSTSFRFVSLSELISEQYAGFGNVWTTRADSGTVYFQAPNHLFVWDGTDLVTVHSEASYHTSFLTSQGLILRERGVGLVKYEAGQTHPIPGGEFFAEMRVFVLEEYAHDFLVGTRDNGFFRLQSGNITPYETGLDRLLSEYWLYTSAPGPDGSLVFGTLGAGIVSMDHGGRMTARITTETGLPDPHITSITPIAPGGYLATTQYNGVFFFDEPGVTTIWGDVALDAVNGVSAAGDSVMVVSGHGLESIRIDRPAAPTRVIMDRTAYLARAVGGAVYVGTDQGVQVWRGDRMVANLLPDEQVMALAPFGQGVIAGFRNGLAWIEGGRVVERWNSGDVRSIAVSGDDIWYATLSAGLHRLSPGPAGWESKAYGRNEGLPVVDRLELANIGGSIRVFADDTAGIYRPAAGWFERDEELSPPGADSQEVWDLVEGPDGRVWIGYADRVVMATPNSRGYSLETVLRFQRQRQEIMATDPHGALWYNQGRRIVRFDPSLYRTVEAGFQATLREVRTRRGGELVTAESGTPVLAFDHRAITVRFGAVHPQGQVDYSWRLLPEETEWSAWSSESEAMLEDLQEGAYTFEVRAQDHSGLTTEPLSFRFAVAPPWYRTWWAYLSYFGFAAGLAWFGFRYQVMVRAQKASEEQARELRKEKVYRQRLEDANQELKKANTLKDNFLAKVSHEIRTPLTAILGFTNIMLDEVPKDRPYREFLEIIRESSDRLMITLDDLLELAKLRAGTREITPESLALSELVEAVTAPIRARAAEKGIFLRVRGASSEAVFADREALAKILYNLVDNAVKFTDSGGVHARIGLADTCECPSAGTALAGTGSFGTGSSETEGCLEIEVEDTGIGIDDRFLPYLFDEFQQESGGESRSHTGTGLGLTIVGGLVDLMGGEVRVESSKASGSVFRVRLPVGVSTDRPPIRPDRQPAPPRLPDSAGRAPSDQRPA